MPLSFAFLTDEPIVTLTGDHATPDEWSRALANIARDPRCDRHRCAILRDRRNAQAPVDLAAVMGIMEVIRRHCTGIDVCRVAILTSEAGDVSAEVADALAYSQQIPVRMFASYDSAIDWLREGLGARMLPSRLVMPTNK